MAVPTITALYAALNAILNILLANRVSTLRRREKVSLGTGESRELLVAVRVHANSAEFVPLALLMMLIAELCGAASVPLHVYGGLLFVGRLMHVRGMAMVKAPNFYRVASNGLTWVGIVVISVYVLWLRTKR
jgi:uncharacterized protein